jgi:hypothetical protein
LFFRLGAAEVQPELPAADALELDQAAEGQDLGGVPSFLAAAVEVSTISTMTDPSPTPRSPPPVNQRKAFLVLAIVGAVAVVGWLVVQRMQAQAQLQDCALAGGRNCAPIDDGNR